MLRLELLRHMMQRYFLLQLYILQDLSAAAVTFRDLQGPAGFSPRDNKAIFPSFDGAVAAREAAPRRPLKTACHLASFWGMQFAEALPKVGKPKKRLAKARTTT